MPAQPLFLFRSGVKGFVEGETEVEALQTEVILLADHERQPLFFVQYQRARALGGGKFGADEQVFRIGKRLGGGETVKGKNGVAIALAEGGDLVDQLLFRGEVDAPREGIVLHVAGKADAGGEHHVAVSSVLLKQKVFHCPLSSFLAVSVASAPLSLSRMRSRIEAASS